MDLTSIDLMIPTSVPPFSREGWVFEFKYDGYRVVASKEVLLTRNKKPATAWYPEVLATLQDVQGDFVMDGEACVLDEEGRPRFEWMRTWAPRLRDRPVTYLAFDLLFLNGEDIRSLPLLERKGLLHELIPVQLPRLRYVQHVMTEGRALYQYAVQIGLEGVLGKKEDSKYIGGRTRNWLKSKPADFHDGWKRRRSVRK